MIKNRTYYYFTLACLCGIILFNMLFYFLNDTYGRGFCAIMLGVLHLGALLLTMGYVGGLSVKEIGFEVAEAAKDFKAGGDVKKPVIVPLTGQQPTPRADRAASSNNPDEPKPRIVIELPKKDDDEPKIPLA